MFLPRRHGGTTIPPYVSGLNVATPGLVGMTFTSPHELSYELQKHVNMYDHIEDRSMEHWRYILNSFVKREEMPSSTAYSILQRIQFRKGVAQYKLSRYRLTGKSSDGLVEVRYSPVGEIVDIKIDPRIYNLPARERNDHILAAVADAAIKGRQVVSVESQRLHADCMRMAFDDSHPVYEGDAEDTRVPPVDLSFLPSEIAPRRKRSTIGQELQDSSAARGGEMEELEDGEEYDDAEDVETLPHLTQNLFARIVGYATTSAYDPAVQAHQVKEMSLRAAQRFAKGAENVADLESMVEALSTDVKEGEELLSKINRRIEAIENRERMERSASPMASFAQTKGGLSMKEQLWKKAGLVDLSSGSLLSLMMEGSFGQSSSALAEDLGAHATDSQVAAELEKIKNM